jgi:hypothetical protein
MTQCYVALRRVVTQCYVEYSKAITRRYVAYREDLLDTKFEKLRAMQVKINSLISVRNLNRIRIYFMVLSSIYEKNGCRKSRATVSLNRKKGSATISLC